MLSLLPTEAWEYTFGDMIRGLSALLNPTNSMKYFHIQGLGDCIPTRSARTALIIAIKALKLRPGAQIGVPLYCCPVVFKAIKAAGCTPCFIDIIPDTFCISPGDLFAKRKQLDALIAVHMFGNLCDMISLTETMHGKPIIEDCAQSLGSKSDGHIAGSFGTIAAFSFRSGKYLSVGEGGAIYSSHADLRARISEITAATPAPTRVDEYKHIVLTFIRSKLRSKPLWGMAGYPIWGLYNKKVDFASKSPIVLRQVFRSDLAIARRRISFLYSNIEVQRANADFYSRNLQLDSTMLCFERPGTYYNRYIYPITFPSSSQRNFMAAFLQSQQISSAKPYEDVTEGAAKHYGYKGDCPVAEQILKRALVIPSNYQLEEAEIIRIARYLNIGWSKIKSAPKRTPPSASHGYHPHEADY
jgi:dTDP-4-amino-4,6-dideoxygalactose transaminase